MTPFSATAAISDSTVPPRAAAQLG
jgi:hypothetical protein